MKLYEITQNKKFKRIRYEKEYINFCNVFIAILTFWL